MIPETIMPTIINNDKDFNNQNELSNIEKLAKEYTDLNKQRTEKLNEQEMLTQKLHNNQETIRDIETNISKVKNSIQEILNANDVVESLDGDLN